MFLYALLAKIFSYPTFFFSLINSKTYFSGAAPGFGCRKRENWTVALLLPTKKILSSILSRRHIPSLSWLLWSNSSLHRLRMELLPDVSKRPRFFFFWGGDTQVETPPRPPLSPPNVSNTKNCDGSWILVHMVLVHTFFPGGPSHYPSFPPHLCPLFLTLFFRSRTLEFFCGCILGENSMAGGGGTLLFWQRGIPNNKTKACKLGDCAHTVLARKKETRVL